MFDQNGIWHEETYNQPQSGLMGALNILNQFQSYNNYQRARARETESDLSNVATMGEKHGQDLYTTPEGSQAAQTLGISPDTTGNVFTSIPQQKLKLALQQAQLEKGSALEPEEVASVYQAQGMPAPSPYLTAAAKAAETERKIDRGHDAMFEKVMEGAKGIFLRSMQNNEAEDVSWDKVNKFVNGFGARLTDEDRKNIQDNLMAAKASAATTVNPNTVSAARVNEMQSRAAKQDALTDQITALIEPKVKALAAGSEYQHAHALLVQQLTEVARLKAKGGMSAKERSDAVIRLAALAKARRDAENIDTTLAPKGSQLTAENEALKGILDKGIETLKNELAEPPQASAQAPTAQTKESIVADFKAKKISRAEAAARLKALGVPE
jgi:hypothetical protein